MNTFQKYDAMLVDPEIDSRMRLKQATIAVTNFGKVVQVGTLREALAKLTAGERCDVIFISHKCPAKEAIDFVKSAKDSKQGQDAAYINVLGGNDQQAATVASQVISGFDGFLFEPYSVDNLVEITDIAARVRKERTQAREEAAIRMLMADIMNQLDLVAYLKQINGESARAFKKLKDTCAVLQTLTTEARGVYERIAIEMLENAPLPKKVFQRKHYSGASSRVKKKMEDKLLAELEKDPASVKE